MADEIPAPFDDLPTIDEPTDEQRLHARVTIPPWAVPDEGPIPDVRYQIVVERELEVPEWVIEAVRWRASRRDPDKTIDRRILEEYLMEYAYISERFVTPDGRDAVDVLLDDLQENES